jgi:Flp pilus assembly protein TadD
MISQSFKQWTIAVFIVIFGVVIFATTRSYYTTEKPANQEYEISPIPESLMQFSSKERQLLALISKDPENADLLTRLGDLYFENKRFEQAIEEYNKVLKINPADVDTYNDLGLALHYTGSSDTAIETLRKGTEVTPSYQRIWLSLGFVLSQAGKNDEARDALKKTIDLGANSEVGLEAKRILDFLSSTKTSQ